MPFSGIFLFGDRTWVSALLSGYFTSKAPKEAHISGEILLNVQIVLQMNLYLVGVFLNLCWKNWEKFGGGKELKYFRAL